MKRFTSVISIVILLITAGCAPLTDGSGEPPAFASPFEGTVTVTGPDTSLTARVNYTPGSSLQMTVTAPAGLKGITYEYCRGKGTAWVEGSEKVPVTGGALVIQLGQLFESAGALSPLQNNGEWLFKAENGTLTVDENGRPLRFELKDETYRGTFTQSPPSRYTENGEGAK